MDSLSKARNFIAEECGKRGVRLLKVYLFGSRARGDSHPGSDWDFFVVVDKELSFTERQEMLGEVSWRLAQEGIYSDIVIRSAASTEQARSDTGRLAYYVLREGVEV